MSIAAKANKVCKSIKKPMSIPSKTRKDQKAHEHSSNPCQKVLKPMSIASKTQKTQPRPEEQEKEMLEWRPPALTNTPLSHAHTASPRPLARTHDTNTKRNRNQFPDWGSPASINSPQSPTRYIRHRASSAGRDQLPASFSQAPTQTTRTQDPGGVTKTQEPRPRREGFIGHPPPFPQILKSVAKPFFLLFSVPPKINPRIPFGTESEPKVTSKNIEK